MIGLVWATESGRQAALRLAKAWPDECTVHDGPVRAQLASAWGTSDAIVAFLATGATVRLVAGLLADKHTDPGVVCVDEAAQFAVALLGGHDGGANALAVRVSEVLGAQPVVTTGTDAAGIPGLDTLGFKVGNPDRLAAVSRAMLDGEPIDWRSDVRWPLPALPPNVGDHPDAAFSIHVTDRRTEPDGMVLSGALTENDERTPSSTSAPEHATPTGPDGTVLSNERNFDVAAAPPRLRVFEHMASGRADDAHASASPGKAALTLVLHPPSLVLGIGASRGVAQSEIAALVNKALAEAGLAPESVRCIATADIKADEAGLVAYAASKGWRILTYSANELSAVPVPNPSEVVRAAVGTPSVSEAAALLAAGNSAELVVPKTASAMATVAVARLATRGRLAIVGLGPGAADLRTPRATAELRAAAIVVGLDQYVEQVRELLRPGTRIIASGLGAEEERARTAVELAREGNAVALIGSGDAGVYAMASPALEFATEDVDVVAVPGITAALAASALLGAPLGHDHVYLSLSDLHTPWEVIEKRLHAASEADLVVCLYNPRSARRTHQLPEALRILALHRPASTPIGLVRDASRAREAVQVTTLATIDSEDVDMNTVVIVGASTTRIVAGRMVTPRGYQWMPQ